LCEVSRALSAISSNYYLLTYLRDRANHSFELPTNWSTALRSKSIYISDTITLAFSVYIVTASTVFYVRVVYSIKVISVCNIVSRVHDTVL